MAPEPCRIREFRPRGYHAVALEHEQLSVTVLPGKGAEIHSIVYRPLDFDVLWKAPWGLHRSNAIAAAHGGSEAAWMNEYAGGWQIIFPSGGDACEVAGAAIGFHGEASVVEWDYACEVTDAAVSVRMSVSLPRTPFHLIREVAIERGSLSVRVTESIWTDAEAGFPAMWGHHPALATRLLTGATIEVPATNYVFRAQENPESARILASEAHAWPMARGRDGNCVDLSRLPRENERLSEMGYLTGLTEGRLCVRNEHERLAVGLEWDKRVFPCVWYWLEWGGLASSPWFGRGRVAAFEPFSSLPGDGLAQAIERGTALQFAPGQRRCTTVNLTIEPL